MIVFAASIGKANKRLPGRLFSHLRRMQIKTSYLFKTRRRSGFIVLCHHHHQQDRLTHWLTSLFNAHNCLGICDFFRLTIGDGWLKNVTVLVCTTSFSLLESIRDRLKERVYMFKKMSWSAFFIFVLLLIKSNNNTLKINMIINRCLWESLAYDLWFLRNVAIWIFMRRRKLNDCGKFQYFASAAIY